MNRLRAWWAAALLACAACSDPAAEDGMREVAGELRALRVELQSRPAAAAAPVLDRELLAAAMAPMREVLTGLVRDMADMQTREAALAQEFQRWSQLLAQSVTDGRKEEAQAMQHRIEALEGDLRAQATRQREAEALMARALDLTSDRLEKLLEVLDHGADKTPAVRPAAPASGGGSGPGAPPPTSGGSTATGNGDKAPLSAALRSGRRAGSPWWYALGVVGLLAGGFFAFWLRRENAAARPVLDPPTDDGARELWAAAALLGEAVGRLRQQGVELQPEALPVDGPALPATPGGPASPQEPCDDDEFVIDDDGRDEVGEPIAAVAVATAPLTAPAAASPPVLGPVGPLFLERLLPSRDPGRGASAVLAIVLRDPRVLRRPAPLVEPTAQAVQVRCGVLPNLSPGQLGHLEQLLRDASR